MEVIPSSQQQDHLRVRDGLRQVLAVPNALDPEDLLRLFSGDRVVGLDSRSFLTERVDDRNCRRLSHVVRTRLEREAEHRDVDALDRGEMLLHTDEDLIRLMLIRLDHRLEDAHRAGVFVAVRDQSLDVLRETASAKATSRLEIADEAGSDSLSIRKNWREAFVQMHTVHHLQCIDTADARAQISDLVRKGDERREKRVRSVLDHLGRLRAGENDVDALERRVQFFEYAVSPFVDATEHDPIWVHEVVDGFAFSKELGVHADPEIHAGHFAGGLLQCGRHELIGGAWHDRALDDDDVVAVLVSQGLPDLRRGLFDISGVDLLPIEGGADGDQRQLAFVNCRAQVGGGSQRLSQIASEQVVEAFLVDRRNASRDFGHLVCVFVDARDLMAPVSKTNARNQTNVARPNDRNSHHASAASRFSAYQISERRRPSST